MTVTYDAAGRIASETVNVSVDDARRVDTGTYVTADIGVVPWLMASGGVRVDHVSNRNMGRLLR